MSRRDVRRVEDRIHLDRLVTLQLWDGPMSDTTGRPTMSGRVQVWAALTKGGSELNIGRESSLLVFGEAWTVRWNNRLDGLTANELRIERDGRVVPVTNVRVLGRRRFLRLEIV